MEYFPVGTIPYRPFDQEDAEDTLKQKDVNAVESASLCFRHYNPDEVLLGKPMKEWLRFSICFWHTLNGSGGMDPFGSKTLQRPWEDNVDDPILLAKRRVDVLFELLVKLRVEYYTFHDMDIAPQGKTLQETMENLDIIVKYIQDKQTVHEYSSVKLLWATQNLFSDPRYMNGAMTNPQVNVFCYAAAQIQQVMDINYELKGQNHVFWGGREGYQSILNTDMKSECDHMAQMYHMAIQYKKKMNYTAQFLIEPKPCEPMKHQYDYDAATTIAFLYQHNLQNDFLLNIEPNHTTLAGHAPEHDIAYASSCNMLGSVDSNTGDTLLGWDTVRFLLSIHFIF
jgi:xylose isomerase